MDLAFIYIGISQSLFGAVLVFLKKPLNIADKILGILLVIISLTFIINLLKIMLDIDNLWPASACIYLLLPACIYLYSKHIIFEYPKFKRSEFLHLIPFIVSVIFLLLVKIPDTSNIKIIAHQYSENFIIRNIVGSLYVLCLWAYGLLSLKNITDYKKQIKDHYSFDSAKINLNWLFILVVSHLAVNNFIIAVSFMHYFRGNIPHAEILRNGALLLFVYALSIWGYKQIQLSSNLNLNSPKLNPNLKKTQNFGSEKYKRSGLKKEQAQEYAMQLITYMNSSSIWKDPELTIKKLAENLNIPSSYISQILSEKLNKNFNTFVNEYRIEYAKELITSSKYSSWSLISISFECGFNSKATFNSFFKKQTGMTPSEFRKISMLE